MQPIAKKGLIFGHCLTKCSIVRLPISSRARHKMKLYRRKRQTVQNTMPIKAQFQTPQDHLSGQVDRTHQVAVTTVITTLRSNVRKQVLQVLLQGTEQFIFHATATTFTNQAHRNQLAICTFWSNSRQVEH